MDGGQHYKSVGVLSSDPNVKVIVQDSSNVKAPEFSHTPGRIYAVVKDGDLKHVAYYDENHNQAVSIDLAHAHKGVQPHRHVYMSHNKNDPGIPPTADEKELINKLKKEFHLKMRKNEYTSLDDFRSQYIGVWAPSEGHWLGLDFSYKGNEYRFQTGSMYAEEDTIFPNGQTAVYGLYRKNKNEKGSQEYCLLSEFATMDDVLISTCIEGRPFAEIIMDDDTELLGQD